jgi:hypothetical protein
MQAFSPTRLGVGYFVLVAAVVLSARVGLYPGVGTTFEGESITAHPYRLAMVITLVLLAGLLGYLASRWGSGEGGLVMGLGALLAGGIITGALLGAAPWFLYPGDQYPVSFMWLLVGAPVGLLSWLAATAWDRQHPAA